MFDLHRIDYHFQATEEAPFFRINSYSDSSNMQGRI